MAHIATVDQEKAQGVIQDGYQLFLHRVGSIPRPMVLLSASPGLFAQQLGRIKYYAGHPNLDPALLTHIRYLAAKRLGYRACMEFNRDLLLRQGAKEDDLARLDADPEQALLEERERALLGFVLRALADPQAGYGEEIENLRALGWQDSDLVDALAQGVSMYDHNLMMQVFAVA
jgi:hypothetical protein